MHGEDETSRSAPTVVRRGFWRWHRCSPSCDQPRRRPGAVSPVTDGASASATTMIGAAQPNQSRKTQPRSAKGSGHAPKRRDRAVRSRRSAQRAPAQVEGNPAIAVPSRATSRAGTEPMIRCECFVAQQLSGHDRAGQDGVHCTRRGRSPSTTRWRAIRAVSSSSDRRRTRHRCRYLWSSTPRRCGIHHSKRHRASVRSTREARSVSRRILGECVSGYSRVLPTPTPARCRRLDLGDVDRRADPRKSAHSECTGQAW